MVEHYYGSNNPLCVCGGGGGVDNTHLHHSVHIVYMIIYMYMGSPREFMEGNHNQIIELAI